MPAAHPAHPFKIRVVAPFNQGNSEICADLPHLHASHIERMAWQPGNPGSSALSRSTVSLFPPGTEQYLAAKVYYDQITRYQRIEWYWGGKLYDAGIITGIDRRWGSNPIFELTVEPDYVLAHKSAPFPGELLSNDVTSAMLKSYLGTNELGWSDGFGSFTAGNYTSTNIPGHTAGTWTGTTDDGFNVVTNSTGTGAELISKTGFSSNDRWFTQYIEVTGRLKPAATSNGGEFGVGLSSSSANANDCVVAYGIAVNDGAGRYTITASIINYSGGGVFANIQVPGVLLNVEDPDGMIPLTVGLLVTLGGNSNSTGTATLIINGKVVLGQFVITAVSTRTKYAMLHSGIGTGAGPQGYFTNLNQFTRFTSDGPSTASVFANGSISTSTLSLGYGVDPGPTFLETWSRLATRNGWYWRYTPQPYVVGTRTLGKIDFAADPGTDRGTIKQVVFDSEDGTLSSLELNNNTDPLAAGVASLSQSTLDGGGVGYWNDPATLSKYGVIQDEVLSFTHSDFNSQRRAAYQISQSKINVDTAGAKSAVINRDPQTADVWRELDKVMLNAPEINVNQLVSRVVAYTLDEGQSLQTLILDYFTEDEI